MACSLDLPQLSNITKIDENDYSGSSGFELGTSGGEPLDISIPRLADVDSMRIVGEIKR